ncbi:hypothetical protein B4Q13_24545 [Lacticaseibacillus rhamnosus]
MSDGVHHQVAHALAFLGGFAAGEVFKGLGPVESEGDETADGLRGFERKCGFREQQQAGRTRAGAARRRRWRN